MMSLEINLLKAYGKMTEGDMTPREHVYRERDTASVVSC